MIHNSFSSSTLFIFFLCKPPCSYHLVSIARPFISHPLLTLCTPLHILNTAFCIKLSSYLYCHINLPSIPCLLLTICTPLHSYKLRYAAMFLIYCCNIVIYLMCFYLISYCVHCTSKKINLSSIALCTPLHIIKHLSLLSQYSISFLVTYVHHCTHSSSLLISKYAPVLLINCHNILPF